MKAVSHCLYDDRKQFDAWETACLIAEVDPGSIGREDLASAPNVRTLLTLIEDAYQSALYCCRALCAGEAVYVDDVSIEYKCSYLDDVKCKFKFPASYRSKRKTENKASAPYAQFGVSKNPSMLPSIELWEACERAIDEGYGLDPYTEKLLNTPNPTFRSEDVEEWLRLIGWQGKQYFIKQKGTPKTTMTTRERETMLKLIIGMAIGRYDHDVNANKTETVSRILKDMEMLGLEISDETIRKYLKEAGGLVPGDPHKD